MFRLDEVLPAFDSEHDVDVNLCVGVGHVRKMPLLTELGNLFSVRFYKDSAPDGAGECGPSSVDLPSAVGATYL